MYTCRQSVELLSLTPDPWKVVRRAAMVSHDSKMIEDKQELFNFAKSLVKAGHGTPLEFVHASFRVVTDRGIANELVRHRVGVSFVQRSTRYCDEGELAVVCPFERGTYSWERWHEAVHMAESAYNALVDMNVQKQYARSVLPLCLATELVMDANLRALRTIYKLRSSPAAHPQMRELMALMMDALPVGVRELVTMEGKA